MHCTVGNHDIWSVKVAIVSAYVEDHIMSNARVRKKQDVLPSGHTQPQQQRQQQQQYIHVLSNTLTLIPKWGGYYSFWTLLFISDQNCGWAMYHSIVMILCKQTKRRSKRWRAWPHPQADAVTFRVAMDVAWKTSNCMRSDSTTRLCPWKHYATA